MKQDFDVFCSFILECYVDSTILQVQELTIKSCWAHLFNVNFVVAVVIQCIPAAFVETYPHTFDRNNNMVTLEGPSRNKWQVKVIGKGNPQFSSGWRAFAYDHGLNEGDQLHFNLVNASHFVVDIFNSDGKVRKSCRHAVNSGKYAPGSGFVANHNLQSQDHAAGRGTRKRKVTDGEYHVYTKWGDMHGGHLNYTTIARRCKTTNRRASYNEYPIAMGGGAGPSVSPKSGKLWECHKDDGGKEVVTILDSDDDDERVRSIPPQAVQVGRTSSKLERLVEYMKKKEDVKLQDDTDKLKRTAKPEVRGDDDRQTMQAAKVRSQADEDDASTEEDTDDCGDEEISEDDVSDESNDKKKKKMKETGDPLRKFSRIFDTGRPKKLKRTPVIGLEPEPASVLAETALNPVNTQIVKPGGDNFPVNLKVKEEKIVPTEKFQIHEVEDSVGEEDEQEETLVSTQSRGEELEKAGQSNLAFVHVEAETNNILFNGGVTQLKTEDGTCATTSKENSEVVKSAFTTVETSSGVQLEVVLGQYDETQKHLKLNTQNASAQEGMQDSGREASIDFTFDTVSTAVKPSDVIPGEANQEGSDVHSWKHPAIAHVTAVEYNQGIQEDEVNVVMGEESQVQSLAAPEREHILDDYDDTHEREAEMNVSQKDASHSISSTTIRDQEADHGKRMEIMLDVTESNNIQDKKLTQCMDADPTSSNKHKHGNTSSSMVSVETPSMSLVVAKAQTMETTSNLDALLNMPEECGTGGTGSSKKVEFDQSFILVSKRRTVTDAEKLNAVKAGQSWAKRLQNPNFVAVMKGSEVYRDFQLV